MEKDVVVVDYSTVGPRHVNDSRDSFCRSFYKIILNPGTNQIDSETDGMSQTPNSPSGLAETAPMDGRRWLKESMLPLARNPSTPSSDDSPREKLRWSDEN